MTSTASSFRVLQSLSGKMSRAVNRSSQLTGLRAMMDGDSVRMIIVLSITSFQRDNKRCSFMICGSARVFASRKYQERILPDRPRESVSVQMVSTCFICPSRHPLKMQSVWWIRPVSWRTKPLLHTARAWDWEATLVQTRSATLHLLPAELQDIGYDFEQFSPCVLRWSDNLVIGGRRIAYRVDLDGEAPPEGAVVQLSSSDPSLISAPESVAIEGRGRYAVFQVVSTPVSITSSVPLQASYRERTIERPLTLVRPPVQYTIQEIRPEGATYVTPVGMNESGQVLIEGENNQYYLWQNGVYTRQHFPAPDGLRARIVDFNDRGQFVGVLREIIHDRGFAVWEDGVRHDRNYTRFAGAQGYYMGGTYVNNQNTFTGGTTQIFRPDASWLTEVTPPLQSDFQQEAGALTTLRKLSALQRMFTKPHIPRSGRPFGSLKREPGRWNAC